MVKIGGSTNRSKNTWPLALQARVIKLAESNSAKEAFRLAIEEYNSTASVKFVAPPSCEKWPASILDGMRKRFAGKVDRGVAGASELLETLGIKHEIVADTK